MIDQALAYGIAEYMRYCADDCNCVCSSKYLRKNKTDPRCKHHRLLDEANEIERIGDQLDTTLSIIGELMSYDNFEAYPPYMKERVMDFMADVEDRI